MLKGLYVLNEYSYDVIYGGPEREEIAKLVDIYAPLQTSEMLKEDPSILRDAEFVLSGWGCPRFDERLLDAAPNLKVIFYGAGSVKGIVSDAFWDRGVRITSAYAANGVPVAEYTLSQILFCLKHGWQKVFDIRREKKLVGRGDIPGAFGTTVGIISLGMIGRLVVKMLRNFDVKVVAYDPFVKPEAAAEMGVELVSLDEVFQRSEVVSLHTPWLPETVGMIKGSHFEQMKQGACFINTARGAVVNEPEMIEVLQKRTDIYAVLDVTYPEPPLPDSPLFEMENVVLTPHVAGSQNAECRRMGQYMIRELKHYIAGEPMEWEIDRERAKILA